MSCTSFESHRTQVINLLSNFIRCVSYTYLRHSPHGHFIAIVVAVCEDNNTKWKAAYKHPSAVAMHNIMDNSKVLYVFHRHIHCKPLTNAHLVTPENKHYFIHNGTLEILN